MKESSNCNCIYLNPYVALMAIFIFISSTRTEDFSFKNYCYTLLIFIITKRAVTIFVISIISYSYFHQLLY